MRMYLYLYKNGEFVRKEYSNPCYRSTTRAYYERLGYEVKVGL